MTTDPPDGRFRHIPNALTLLRIALVPVIVALMMADTPSMLLLAAILFCAASLTDWLDGYAARRLGVESNLGRMLDPIADKLLVVAVLVVLIAIDRIAGWAVVPALVIMLREFLVGGVREFLAGIGAAGLPSSPLAKVKTAVQMAALLTLMVAGEVLADLPLAMIGLVGLWLAAVLAAVSAGDYLAKALGQVRTITGSRTAP